MRHEVEPILDAQVSLSDGRSLAYAVWGDPDGQTVLLFHGAPGSRMFTPDPDLTARAGVRLVTVDRPGYGRSDADPGRTILDWPADILQLADAIQAPRFAIAAHSSGGPYALACAVQLSNRISAVTLVSCPAPYDVPIRCAGPVPRAPWSASRSSTSWSMQCVRSGAALQLGLLWRRLLGGDR